MCVCVCVCCPFHSADMDRVNNTISHLSCKQSNDFDDYFIDYISVSQHQSSIYPLNVEVPTLCDCEYDDIIIFITKLLQGALCSVINNCVSPSHVRMQLLTNIEMMNFWWT